MFPLGVPKEMSGLSAMQQEHRAWVQEMYPDQKPWIPAAGCVEEAGELFHCILKIEQTQTWGHETRHGDLTAKMVDAIGDCLIYACSLCNATGWDFAQLYYVGEARSHSAYVGLTPLAQCSMIVKAACGVFDEISPVTLTSYLEAVIVMANMSGVNPEEAALKTWQEVRQRCRK
jgi:NTP pyrophosphatase (non-canonical NTP hydrolase)